MINSLGKKLKNARIAKHLTQEQLSELSGVSLPQFSRLERNICSPTVDTLFTLCDALNVGLDEVLYEYLPQDTEVQNPNIKHVIAMMNSMNDKQRQYIEDFIALYRSHHQE